MQKKCFIASTGFHLLLVSLLFIGPAFLSSSSKMQDVPMLTFIPYKTTDKDASGGGYRDGGSPPPVVNPPKLPPEVKPPAPAPEAIEPAPPKEIAPPKEDSFSLAVKDKQKRSKPEISTTLVKRDKSSAISAAKAKAAAQARAAAEAQNEAINRFGQAVDRIGGELSSGISGKILGPGGGGIPYANFLQGVKKVYSDRWLVPDGIKDDSATVTVSVTIGRDGTVLSSHITRRSGDPAVDQSVQMTLDRVTRVVPLPEDSTDRQRTVTINFNVRAKLLG